MSHTYRCLVCSLELTVSDKLFSERIGGKRVSVRCKRCKSLLQLTKPDVATASSASPKAGSATHTTVAARPKQTASLTNLPRQHSGSPERDPVEPVQAPRLTRPAKVAAGGESGTVPKHPPPRRGVPSSQPSIRERLEEIEELVESGTCSLDPDEAEAELTPPATMITIDLLPPSGREAATVDVVAAAGRRVNPWRSMPRQRIRQICGAAVVLSAILAIGLLRAQATHPAPVPTDSHVAGPQHADEKSHALLRVASTATTPTSVPIVTPASVPASTSDKSAGNIDAHTATQQNGAGAPTSDDAIPDYVFKPAVVHLTGRAIRRAQRCHPKGHAVGTARVFFTFSPNGRVTEASLEGEPVASAPVARCILDHAHAIQMKKFDGPPFTISLPITLR